MSELTEENVEEVLVYASPEKLKEIEEVHNTPFVPEEVIKHPEITYRWLGDTNYEVEIKWPNNTSGIDSIKRVAQLLQRLHSGELAFLTLEVLRKQGVVSGQQDLLNSAIEEWTKFMMLKKDSSSPPIVPPQTVFTRIANL